MIAQSLDERLDERYVAASRWPADLGVDGSCVVCVGATVPRELIAARGLRYVPLTGRAVSATPAADRYLEGGYGLEFRSILEQLLSGMADRAALIVLDRRFRDIFYYLKEIVRLGSAPGLPPLHMFDLLLTRALDVSEYNREQMRLLDAQLLRRGGQRDTEQMEQACREAGAWREEVRRLLAHRRHAVVNGVAAFRALSAVRTMELDDHRAALAALNADLESAVPDGRPRALLLSSEPMYTDWLHAAVEAAGVIVTAEDSEWGTRLAGGDVDSGTDPLEALLQKYWFDARGPELRPFEARASWLRSALAEYRPDVVVVHVPPNDHYYGWDYPAQLPLIQDAGARAVLVQSAALHSAEAAEATDAVRRALSDQEAKA